MITVLLAAAGTNCASSDPSTRWVRPSLPQSFLMLSLTISGISGATLYVSNHHVRLRSPKEQPACVTSIEQLHQGTDLILS